MATRRNNRRAPRGRTDARTVESPVPGTSSDLPRYRDPLEFIRANGIRDQLQDVTVNNDRDSMQDMFITEHSLRKIWNGGLLRELLELLGYEDNGLVGDVLMNLIKTISILVSIRWDQWHRFAGIFLEYREGAALRHDRKDRKLPHPLQVLEDASFLGKSWAVDFSRMQSSFLPIIIEQGKNATYSRTRPLPFIRSKREKIATGAYGVVTKETIAKYQFLTQDDYHSRDLRKEEMIVARKSFPARGDFSKEARNLARFNGSLSDHKRIVKYLAVITIEDEEDEGAPKEFNILLPLADADLERFLNEQSYELRCGGIVELIIEASNLCDAVRWLHSGLRISGKVLFCCHMDLKLQNILVYLENPSQSRVGWWKISDFGISSMVERATLEQSPRRPSSTLLSVPSPAQSLARITGTARFSVHRPPGTYTAPELEVGNEVGPSSDIWSLGCILYQVLARGAGGIELLKELNDKRMSMENGSTNDHFYQRTNRGNCLHPSVSEWLESPHSLPNGRFSDRIMIMRCKRLIETTLQSDPTRRPNAEKLHEKLAQIADGEGETILFDQDHNLVLPDRSEARNRRLLADPTPEIEITTPSSSMNEAAAPHPFRHEYNIPVHVNNTPPMSPPVGGKSQIGQPNNEPSRDGLPILPSTGPTVSVDQFPRRTTIPTSNPPTSPETAGRDFNAGDFGSRAHISHRSDISVPELIPPPSATLGWYALNPENNTSGNGTSYRGSTSSHESQRQPNGQRPQHIGYYFSDADVSRRSDNIGPQSIPPPSAEWRTPNSGNVISGNGTSNRGSIGSHESPRQSHGQSSPHVGQYHSGHGRDRQFVETSPEPIRFNSTIFDSYRQSRQQSEHTDVPEVEPRPKNLKGEIIPFTTPHHVIMTLVSSTRAKIAFVAPKEVVVSTLYNPYSREIISPPTGCSWEEGSLAGDFLALRGFCSSNGSYVFQLWKLSIDYRHRLEIRRQNIQYELPHFEKFAVSRDGKLLVGGSRKVWFYQSINSREEELEVGPAKSGKLKHVWFSTNGMLLFAWFVLPGNHHHVRVWDADDTKITGGLDYQVPPSEHSTMPLKAMVHFPKAPLCLLWKEHDVVELLQHPTPPSTQQVLNCFHVKNLQAMVVTPNEEAVIFITSSTTTTWRGLRHVSKISVARITKLVQGNYRILGDISGDYTLTYHLDSPAKCDIVIEEHTSSDTQVKVLIAHSNGNFEVKDIPLTR